MFIFICHLLHVDVSIGDWFAVLFARVSFANHVCAQNIFLTTLFFSRCSQIHIDKLRSLNVSTQLSDLKHLDLKALTCTHIIRRIELNRQIQRIETWNDENINLHAHETHTREDERQQHSHLSTRVNYSSAFLFLSFVLSLSRAHTHALTLPTHHDHVYIYKCDIWNAVWLKQNVWTAPRPLKC